MIADDETPVAPGPYPTGLSTASSSQVASSSPRQASMNDSSPPGPLSAGGQGLQALHVLQIERLGLEVVEVVRMRGPDGLLALGA